MKKLEELICLWFHTHWIVTDTPANSIVCQCGTCGRIVYQRAIHD